MKIINFDEVVSQTRTHLGDYLYENGLIASPLSKEKFICLNPEHNDSHPSMSIMPSGNLVKCFSCNSRYDIYNIHSILKGAPVSGPTWLNNNLLSLANKYDVDVVKGQVSEDELYRWRTQLAYNYAAQIVTDTNLGNYTKTSEEMKRREWSLADFRENQIGTVSFQDYVQKMIEYGFDQQFLNEVDLYNKNIFNDNNLIFAIHDYHGNPIGFTARNLDYDDSKSAKENGAPKYINSSSKNLIFNKSNRLYNIYDARHLSGDTIYLVESQASAVTLKSKGIENCVAQMGSCLSHSQLLLLREAKKYHVVLCYDGDDAGQKSVLKALDEQFPAHTDLTVSIIKMPDGYDPDDYVREFGKSGFDNLHRMSSFSWRLLQFDIESPEYDEEEVCRTMLPFIVSEQNRITRNKYVDELALFTQVNARSIADEVERLSDIHSIERNREIHTIIDRAFSQIKQKPETSNDILANALDAIEDVDSSYMQEDFSEKSCLDRIKLIKDVQDSRDGEFMGFYMKEFPIIQGHFEDWRQGKLVLIGGKENTGKTSLTCKLAYQIANDKRNDALVIYHTIDDSFSDILNKFICHASDNELTLGEVANPNLYLNRFGNQSVVDKRNAAYVKLDELVKDGRLIIKDAEDATTLTYGQKLVKYYKAKYPNRNIIYIVDNFHKLTDYEGEDQRAKFSRLSSKLKLLAVTKNISCWAVVEYTRMGRGIKPNNDHISETRALQYDANIILHLYNELHERPDSAGCVNTVMEKGKPKNKPRIELIVGKNKCGSFKGREFLDFYPDCGNFVQVERNKVKQDHADRVLSLREENERRTKSAELEHKERVKEDLAEDLTL